MLTQQSAFDEIDWSSDEVKTLFTTDFNPPAEGGTTEEADTDSGSAPIGAIVGGVVGGIGGAALIGVLAWMLVRRKRKTAVPTSDPDNHPSDTEAGGQYGAYPNDSKAPGIAETHGNNGYAELPARDAAAAYPVGGPAEMESKSHKPPAEMDSSSYAPPPAELGPSNTAGTGARPVEMGATAYEMDATPVTPRQ